MKYEIINNLKVFAPTTRKELIDFAFCEKKILIAINAEKILHATEVTKEIINNNIGYPDGIGAVWALQKKGVKDIHKIPGCELWLDIVKESVGEKSFYLIGGSEEVIQSTVTKLKKDFPKIKLLGFRNGYLQSELEKNQLIDKISESKPDVVFVAMGSPKQEILMRELCERHPALYQGLGGSFDVYVGTVKRAPEWWVSRNLEWAFRLLKQPRRIMRQKHLIVFYFKLLLNKF
ncbi:WecB/TagA/CpsF family glycosyltransferase [Aquiflexum sp. LQ15W]|uniref:WecB/TagA/CpsF family glycosyltransferase n=1 Tax=Cognataquiflexum nitidum TaxID=2922272 RepID=UPI001F13C8AE|nr:WecB/TagA/CpsF family glycosyltransferase [Cognataquiflexum nitidum]MCH6198336.1 WecB/TagA/CpsF family glycosyltransferase [Cognataquiflexum nitidum]